MQVLMCIDCVSLFYDWLLCFTSSVSYLFKDGECSINSYYKKSLKDKSFLIILIIKKCNN